MTEAEAIIEAFANYQCNHGSGCTTNLHKMVLLLEGKFLNNEDEKRQEYIDKFISEHLYGIGKCFYCDKWYPYENHQFIGEDEICIFCYQEICL